jgi:beta-N-acetylhexosaminidase
LDVNVNPDNPEIYTRSFGDDPAVVAKYAKIVLQAFDREGVCGIGKHFPGRGQSAEDAHYEIPRYSCTRKQMDKIDLAPYRKLIGKGCGRLCRRTRFIRVWATMNMWPRCRR